MGGSLWLPDGSTPQSFYGSTTSNLKNADPRLWYPFDPNAFTLPGITSLGIGNAPPTLTYGPGVENIDMGLEKLLHLGASDSPRTLSFKVEAFNLFNHFNPGNPNTTLNLPCNVSNAICLGGQANTNSAFGTISSAQTQARHASLTVRFRF